MSQEEELRMFDKYDPAKNLYEKNTDWGAVLAVIILILCGIGYLAA